MFRILILNFLLLLSFIVFTYAQTVEEQKLFPFELDNKCGYLNQQGAIVVSPIFDLCRSFKEGLAGVSLMRKHGYIDEKGEVIIPLKFEGVFPESFSQGYAPIKIRNENGNLDLGYVDKSGKLYILENVSEVYSFYQELALIKKDGKFGYIDKNMSFIILPQYDYARSFADGLTWVSNKSGKEFYIDKAGRQVITDFGINGSDFSEGFAKFRDKYVGYGYMDTNGKIVIKPQFNSACIFKNGFACVKVDGKWGYINKSGILAIKSQFDEASNFSLDGIAVVKVNGKYGFINLKGEFITSPQFDEAEWLDGIGVVKLNDKRIYLNSKNQIILETKLN
jgi:hypothetical protein